MTFADLADGGRRLAALLVQRGLTDDVLLVRVGVGGLVTGAAVSGALDRDVVPVRTERDGAGVRVDLSTVEVAGREVWVVDDGVESGTAALAVGAALREAGVARAVLAVPVCPVEADADLRACYDDVIAVTRPQRRGSLRGHYGTFA